MKVKAIDEDLFLNKRKIKIGNLAEKQKDLITDGEAIKTGRKIDGKDEYVRRYKISGINSAGDYEVPLGFTLTDVIVTDIRGTLYSSSQNYFTINSGISSAMTYDYLVFCDNSTNGIKIRTYNSNFSEATIDVYYTYRN